MITVTLAPAIPQEQSRMNVCKNAKTLLPESNVKNDLNLDFVVRKVSELEL